MAGAITPMAGLFSALFVLGQTLSLVGEQVILLVDIVLSLALRFSSVTAPFSCCHLFAACVIVLADVRDGVVGTQ